MRVGSVIELQRLDTVGDLYRAATGKERGEVAIDSEPGHLRAMPVPMAVVTAPTGLKTVNVSFSDNRRKQRVGAVDARI